MIKLGATTKAKDALNWTPLHYAIKTKNLEIVRILIENGSEINALANRKEAGLTTWSPLCGAVQKANLELVKLLIENGAELNPKAKNTGVPLHFAVTSAFSEERKKAANFEVIKCLIENGAEVDAKNFKGKTPLFYAVKNDLDMEIVEYFITCGADSYAKTCQTLVIDDLCPLQLAISKKHALKKYDQFVRNTSCFCTMCDFHKNTFFAISKMAKTQFLHQKKV